MTNRGEMNGDVVVMKKAASTCMTGEVREATSGRVVGMLPKLWAAGKQAGLVSALDEANTGLSPLRDTTKSRSGREDIPTGCGTARGTCRLPESEVAFYRKYTEALLRRYQRLSRQAGRVPSPMDREFCRGRMSHYKVQGFDDAVIFCVDVERCLLRLNAEDQRLVRRIAVQQYSMGEAAGVLGISLRSCIVLYRRALDRTTRLFLAARILEPERGCQGAETC